MTKSSGTGRGRVKGSKNVPKEDSSQRRIDVFLQTTLAEQNSHASINPDTTSTFCEPSTSAAIPSSSSSEVSVYFI